MADENIKVNITIEGNADKALKQVTKAFGKFEKQATSAANNASSSFNVFKGVIGGAAVVGALRTLSASIGDTFNKFVEFDAALAEVNTLLPKTSKLTRTQTDELIKLSAQFGTKSTDQVKALYQAISAGAGTASESIEFLTVANQAAAAGITSVESAVDALTSVTNAYASQNVTAAQASDVLFKAVQFGKTTFDEIGSSIGKVAPLAAAAGVSFADLGGTIAFLTKSGVSTEEAITGLRAVVSSFIKPSSEAQKFAKSLGVEFSVSSLQSKGFSKSLFDLIKATGGNEAALAKLFPNVQALGPVISIAKGNFEDFEQILKGTEDAFIKGGVTAEAFGVIQESLSFRIKRLGSTFDALSLKTAADFKVITGAFVDFTQGVADSELSVKSSIASIADTLGFLVFIVERGITGIKSIFAAIPILFTGVQQAVGESIVFIVEKVQSFADLLPGVSADYSNFINTIKRGNEALAKELEGDILAFEDVSKGNKGLQDLAQNLANIAVEADLGLGRFSDNAREARVEQEKLNNEVPKIENAVEPVKAVNEEVKKLSDQLKGLGLSFEEFSLAEEFKIQQEELQLVREEGAIADEEFFLQKDQLNLARQEREQAALEQALKKKEITEQQFNNALIRGSIRTDAQLRKNSLARTQFEKQQAQARLQGASQLFGNLATLQQTGDKTLFRIGQAAAVAQAVVNVALGVTKALSLGPILGPALAASVAVAGAVQIATISAQKLQTGIDSVPGTGTSDNFPAILAPGERVVPTKTNQDLTSFLEGSQGNQALLASINDKLERLSPSVSVNIGATEIVNELREAQEEGRVLVA